VAVNKRRHVWTGRPKGAPIGSANAHRHGMQSAAFLARRGQVAAAIREARALVREAKTESKISIWGNSPG
jgi:hypothetical protein